MVNSLERLCQFKIISKYRAAKLSSLWKTFSFLQAIIKIMLFWARKIHFKINNEN